MPTIRYDFAHSIGGSPNDQSRKHFRRLSNNSAMIISQIKYNNADFVESKTPCLQNELEVMVTITGNSLFYDVIVNVIGSVNEQGSRNKAIPKGFGRVRWHYDDYTAQVYAEDIMNAFALPIPLPRITPVSYKFTQRILNGIPTKVCETTTTGSMTIKEPQEGGLVSLQNISIIQVDINFIHGWIEVPKVGTIPSGDISKPSTVPGRDTTRDTEDYGYNLVESDESLVAMDIEYPGGEYPWSGQIPQDEEMLKELLVRVNIDPSAILVARPRNFLSILEGITLRGNDILEKPVKQGLQLFDVLFISGMFLVLLDLSGIISALGLYFMWRIFSLVKFGLFGLLWIRIYSLRKSLERQQIESTIRLRARFKEEERQKRVS